MPAVAALYRHPVKGFTPEPLAEAMLEAGGWFPDDRMFAVEVGPSGFDPEAPRQIPKTKFAVLMRCAALARVRTRWDEADRTLSVGTDAGEALSVRLDDADDRAIFEAWLSNFLTRIDAGAKGPLRLIEAGERHRFMDSGRGRVSILNLASVRDLETRTGWTIDPLRFRANVWVEGWPAWVENGWVENGWSGQALTIGGATLRGEKPIVRCAAVEVDPVTGLRDREIVRALFDHYGHMHCGLYVSIETGGRIALKDAVTPR